MRKLLSIGCVLGVVGLSACQSHSTTATSQAHPSQASLSQTGSSAHQPTSFDLLSQSQKDAAKAVLDKGITAYKAQDYATALPLFVQAGKLGHIKASRYLGLMYLNGEGVTQSNQHAFDYFNQAAISGDITGQYWLGYCYENGIGVAQDYAKALQWYTTSSQRGDIIAAPAMIAMGKLYEQGKGVTANQAKAIELYRQAMNTGDNDGKAQLERLHVLP